MSVCILYHQTFVQCFNCNYHLFHIYIEIIIKKLIIFPNWCSLYIEFYRVLNGRLEKVKQSCSLLEACKAFHKFMPFCETRFSLNGYLLFKEGLLFTIYSGPLTKIISKKQITEPFVQEM